MHVLRHPNEVLAFLENSSDPCVTALVKQRMDELTDEDTDMGDLVVFVVLEAGDGIPQLQMRMGMLVMSDLGCPLWEVIEEHGTCYELVFVLSSSGFGTLIFAPKQLCAPDILVLCQEHAYRRPPTPPPDVTDAAVTKETAHRGGFLLPAEPEEPHEANR